jgi:hypothetical protein
VPGKHGGGMYIFHLNQRLHLPCFVPIHQGSMALSQEIYLNSCGKHGSKDEHNHIISEYGVQGWSAWVQIWLSQLQLPVFKKSFLNSSEKWEWY